MTSRIAVIDFETTGSSPGQGARATEVAIVIVERGAVVDSYQSLMNGGVWVPPFITQLTGITNAMVAEAPPASEVMAQASRFVGETPLVAHNAAFDRGFWQAELARADVIIRPQVLDIGAADFSQRANAIVEGEKAALAVMPQIRERVAQLQAERAKAAAQAQQKAAEVQYQACLDNRSRLQKLAGLAKLDDSCPTPK